MRKIGLYNSKVEGCECLKDCDLILDNFEDLQKNIKEKDEVILVSGFSLYDYDMRKILSLMENKNVLIYENGQRENIRNKIWINAQVSMIFIFNNYIRDCLETIKML